MRAPAPRRLPNQMPLPSARPGCVLTLPAAPYSAPALRIRTRPRGIACRTSARRGTPVVAHRRGPPYA
eukprot:638488-Alexandrium_andersonii.AAC.1